MQHPEHQYLNLARDILDNGVKQEDMGTGAVTHSVFGRQIRFDLSLGFPLLTTKKTYWKAIIWELWWFLSGQTNIKSLVDNNIHIWDDYPYKIYLELIKKGEVENISQDEFIKKIANDNDFAKKYGELPRIYGEMWRNWPTKTGRTIDQVQWVVDQIKMDPDCHNALVNSWNPEYLYEMALLDESSRFPICHNMYQCNVKNGKLSLQLYQRTADIFLGVPFNIASYALLTHVLAKITGYEPGEYIHTFGDVHAYSNHIDQLKKQLKKAPLPFPALTISDHVKTINDFKPEHAILTNYQSHETIKAELSPAGGFKSKDWEEHLKTKKKQEIINGQGI